SLYAGQNISALRAALNWETPTVNTELPHRSTADIGIDRVHQIALEHGLSGPVEITPPEDGSAYQVQQVQRSWPTKQDAIAVDPATGEITETLRFADYPLMAKLTRRGIDAHMGLLFGLPNQLLLAALGIALLLLIFWGYRMWWPPRPGGLGRPPARGTWRRVTGRVLAPVIAAAVLIAHALPVFGVSLLLFLAIDGVLGWLHRRRAQLTTGGRSEEHTSELQSRENLVCRLLLEKKNKVQDRVRESAEAGAHGGARRAKPAAVGTKGQQAMPWAWR